MRSSDALRTQLVVQLCQCRDEYQVPPIEEKCFSAQRLTTVNVARRMKSKHFVPKARTVAPRGRNPHDGRNSESLDMATFKATDTITVIEGYDAIRVFLETVWRRHGRPVEQIAFLLGSLKWADGTPVDPISWQDWQAAVQTAVSAGSCEIAAGR